MKRFLVVAIVTIILLSLLAGCSPAQTTTPSVANQDKYGGTLRMAVARGAVAFGYPPRIAGPDQNYGNAFFDKLLLYDHGGVFKPVLATSWDIAADGKSITMKLRQGVKFHDGTDFNAQAAKFNLDALIPPKSSILAGVTSVDVVDNYTIRINLPAYNSMVLYALAVDMRCAMYSPTAFEKNGADWMDTHPVGTGPFMLKGYERNASLSLTKNPNYWEKGLPYLDGMELITMTDPMTQMASFKAGQIDTIFDATHTIAAQLRDSGYPLQAAPGSFWALGFDTAIPDSIFRNQKLRMAVEYAIDKEAMAQGTGLGIYKSAYQFASEGLASYCQDCPPRKYDLAKAKQLLAEAGYANGFQFKVTVQDTTWRDGITAAQAFLKQAGITMDINFVNAAAINVMRAQGKIDKSSAGQLQIESYSNSLYTLERYLREDSPVYQFVQRPKGVNALFDQARSARDLAEQKKIAQQIVKTFYDDVTAVPVWLTQRIVISDKSVQDLGWFYDKDSNNNVFGRATWIQKK